MGGSTVAVLGGGGREHALTYLFAGSDSVGKVYCGPGNAGTGILAENIRVDLSEHLGFRNTGHYLQKLGVDYAVVGPENPLADGIVDVFEVRCGIPTFGPRQNAAFLEASKVEARLFMREYGIPTPVFRVTNDVEQARNIANAIYADGDQAVVKADGLAYGKGVIVTSTLEEAYDAIDRVMVKKEFKDAGRRVVIEERLFGEEATILGLSDEQTIRLLASSQDHKPAYDGDEGPNTGGMGAYSPAPVITEELEEEIIKRIAEPTIAGMRDNGTPFKGILYMGLMITENGPKVLEYNIRFGDPEIQPLALRMKSDFFPYVEACARGDGLSELPPIEWDPRPAVAVVMASGGYPGHYEKGYPISGLGGEWSREQYPFLAGVQFDENHVPVTTGGRVIAATALGNSIEAAQFAAYDMIAESEGAEGIRFKDMQFRGDIADKALAHE